MVSVITVNYNGIDDTRNFLDSFRRSVFTAGYEMIVVDNGSVRNEAETLSREYDWIKAIRSEDNLGFAGGNNLGIKNASGSFYLFVNNDIIVDSDFVLPLINRLSADEKAGVVSPRIVYPDHRLYYAGCKPLGKNLIKIKYISGGDTAQSGGGGETALAHGACMMVKREAVEKAGLWPEMYFLYSEEVDWCLSIKKAGFSIWYESAATVCHIGGRSTGANSPLRVYYNTRNRFLLYKRNLKGFARLSSILYELAVAIPKRCVTLALSKRKDLVMPVVYGVKDAMLNKFGKRRY